MNKEQTLAYLLYHRNILNITTYILLGIAAILAFLSVALNGDVATTLQVCVWVDFGISIVLAFISDCLSAIMDTVSESEEE